MKILVVSNLYPPNAIGGYERLCFEVASELAERGQEIVVLTSKFGDAIAEFPGQRVHRELQLLIGNSIYEPYQGSPAARSEIESANARTAISLIEAERPDVIFVWNLFFLGASFFDSLRSAGVRTVVMLTDNWFIVMREPTYMTSFFDRHTFGNLPFDTNTRQSLPRWAPAAIRQWFRGRLLGDARPTAMVPAGGSAIFGSHFMRTLHRAAGLSFAEERVIHNGVRQYDNPPEAFPDRTHLVEKSELRLLFAGRVTEFKGVHTILDALPSLTPDLLGVERVRLSIVGDTQDTRYVAEMKSRLRDYRGPVDVRFAPLVSEDALFDLFCQHDIYLFPSLYEPFSLTLIHALAAGIPTIASAVGGNPEIVRDFETGLLFRKSDATELVKAIEQLAHDPALRNRIAIAGRNAAADYTFQNMVDGMLAFLQSTDDTGARPKD